MVDADTDPSLVLRDIIDTVGDGLAERLVDEIVYAELLGLPLGSPLLSRSFEVADKLLLFSIDRNHRLPAPLSRIDAGVDKLELCVAVRMLIALNRLARALKAVAKLAQKLTDLLRACLKPPLLQLPRQRAGAFCRSSQR